VKEVTLGKQQVYPAASQLETSGVNIPSNGEISILIHILERIVVKGIPGLNQSSHHVNGVAFFDFPRYVEIPLSAFRAFLIGTVQRQFHVHGGISTKVVFPFLSGSTVVIKVNKLLIEVVYHGSEVRTVAVLVGENGTDGTFGVFAIVGRKNE